MNWNGIPEWSRARPRIADRGNSCRDYVTPREKRDRGGGAVFEARVVFGNRRASPAGTARPRLFYAGSLYDTCRHQEINYSGAHARIQIRSRKCQTITYPIHTLSRLSFRVRSDRAYPQR